jgi:tetratricopeptide (TPR) repeat protein
MKKQILAVALGFVTVVSFGQKNELKAAEKALKKQDFTGAIASVTSAEALISNADAKLKSKFYFLKGQAFAGKKQYKVASDAYMALFDFEKQTGKKRYSDKALPLLKALKDEVNNLAFKFHGEKNFKEASKAFYLRYTLGKKDTLFLSNAAQLSLQVKDYDNSFKYYKELLDLGYTGIRTVYEATDKDSGKKTVFSSKKEMDLMSKTGKYQNPTTNTTKSKKGEISKFMVSILSKQKKFDEAVILIKEIRATDSGNLDLILTEAFLYNDLKQPKKFEALMKEATEKDPTNPDLYYNIGIVNYNTKNIGQSLKYFTKTVELKPDYPLGNWMLANALLMKDEALVKKMNDLPPSDMKNYEKLEKERSLLFKQILPILRNADAQKRTAGTVRLLLNIFENLEMDAKAKEYRALLKTLQ